MTKPTLEESLQRLKENEYFRVIMEDLERRKDQAVADLHGCQDDFQQRTQTGKLMFADELLDNYRAIQNEKV